MTSRALAGLVPALALAGGCLAKPALVPELFSIDAPATQEPRSAAGAFVVAVKKVEVAPAFDGRALVYRTGEHRLERDPYASFAAPPGDLLTGAVRGYLRNAPFARDVVEQGGAPRVDLLVVEVLADEISGDLRPADHAAAILRLRFLVTAGGAGQPRGEPLLEKEYARRAPVPRRTAQAIATGWNEELSGVMTEFVGDVEAALARAPPPAAPAAPR